MSFFTQQVRQDVLPTALSLCQDPEAEVRRCMCRQLAHLARGLGAEAARSVLLPQLVELAADEEARVRAAAAEAAVQVMPLLDEDARRAVMAPLVIKSCDQVKRGRTLTCTTILTIYMNKMWQKHYKLWQEKRRRCLIIGKICRRYQSSKKTCTYCNNECKSSLWNSSSNRNSI